MPSFMTPPPLRSPKTFILQYQLAVPAPELAAPTRPTAHPFLYVCQTRLPVSILLNPGMGKGYSPAMPKGAPKPTAMSVVSFQSAPQSTVCFYLYAPMKPQYRTKKNLVNGLKGMLFRGPSG
ncbi:hypothetical protein LTR65_008508 [Meristemomyces frigidus]